MATNFEKIKSVDKKSRNLVFGFSRRCQNTLLPTNNVQYIIPNLIIYTILLYYYIRDEWFKRLFEEKAELVNDNKHIVRSKESCCTVFGSRIITHGIFKWRLRLNKFVMEVINICHILQ